jgi:hypothetical protein
MSNFEQIVAKSSARYVSFETNLEPTCTIAHFSFGGFAASWMDLMPGGESVQFCSDATRDPV